MFFDRNELHIQVGVLFNNENVSFSIPHLRKIIFKIYIQKTQENQQKTKRNHKKYLKKNKKNTEIWYLGHTDSEKNRFFDVPD